MLPIWGNNGLWHLLREMSERNFSHCGESANFYLCLKIVLNKREDYSESCFCKSKNEKKNVFIPN